jgi:hypothetical protein
MDTRRKIAHRAVLRLALVMAGALSALALVGPGARAAPVTRTAEVPVCAAADGESVCIQGWSTGLTLTYSGSSTDAHGTVFRDGAATWGDYLFGAPRALGSVYVNWQGTGTLFVPLGPGQYPAIGSVFGATATGQDTGTGPVGTSVTGLLDVGPGEPAPPTTCSTVALGTVRSFDGLGGPLSDTSSGMAASENGACPGYWITSPTGSVNSVGGAAFLGCAAVFGRGCSAGGLTPPLNGSVVGIVRTPDSLGYWLTATDGGVFAFGDATFFGSMADRALNRPIVGIASTSDGQGYWLVASDGGVFAFGDAGFYGSMGGRVLNRPIVGMASTPDGKGYWLVASDGGVFAFGDAAFRGSTGDTALQRPIVGIASTSDGGGYWLVASDGGVFAFGAPFLGSLGGIALSAPIVGVTPSVEGEGYYLLGADSAVYAFGSARYLGSPSAYTPPYLYTGGPA